MRKHVGFHGGHIDVEKVVPALVRCVACRGLMESKSILLRLGVFGGATSFIKALALGLESTQRSSSANRVTKPDKSFVGSGDNVRGTRGDAQRMAVVEVAHVTARILALGSSIRSHSAIIQARETDQVISDWIFALPGADAIHFFDQVIVIDILDQASVRLFHQAI